MSLADASPTALRVLREVAERGTLTAAARALGYTQSAVSRQIAALERLAGAPLLDRRHDGVRLTPAGQIVLRRGTRAIEELDAAARELAGLPGEEGTVRLGWIPTVGVDLLPRALALVRQRHPAIVVLSREGRTPALVRALRAGTVELALLASAPPFRPPDSETPAFVLRTLTERTLRVAVPESHPLADREDVDVTALRGQRWIGGSGDDPVLGVWPGLDERPEIAHTARDWLAKLHLVAAGGGITTVPGAFGSVVPRGVRVLPVRGGPGERRRIVLAHLPRPLTDAASRVVEALQTAAGWPPAT